MRKSQEMEKHEKFLDKVRELSNEYDIDVFVATEYVTYLKRVDNKSFNDLCYRWVQELREWRNR